MKYLYLVDYWVPFPSSEYGGLVSLIAANDNECHDILLDWRDDYTEQYDNLIMEKVKNYNLNLKNQLKNVELNDVYIT